jgi:8-oxo-dGTP pyrophosphatase MutT (NUDIX family)
MMRDRGHRLAKAGKGVKGKELRRQYGALPIAVRDGETMVMLVTSRETRRWIIPKGWPEAGLEPRALAGKEAFEEAGLVGEVAGEAVGSYRYGKRLPDGREVPCEVVVYPLAVERQLEDWPERGQRETRWFSLPEAAMRVAEGGLVALLLGLAAREGGAAR